MIFTHALGTNNYGPAKFIVDASAANGTHTTIAAALTSASSGDTVFIRPGTYTENLTLKAGVNLVAFRGDSDTPNVTIIGKATFTAAGTVAINNIRLQTNSDFLLAITGSAASILILNTCYLNCTNNTGISFTTSSGSAELRLINCRGDIGTTGITFFSMSSAGLILLRLSSYSNSGGSSTANTISAGSLILDYSSLFTPLTSSGTGSVTFFYSNLSSSTQNVTALTVGGSGNNGAVGSVFQSGTASAISIGSSFNISLCSVNSSNTNAVTGAGTLVNSGISFYNTSSLINTTTQTARNFDVGGISFDGGTNVLSNYTEGTYTPTMVGGSVTGATTYSTQAGFYRRIGNLVVAQATIACSAATGTGDLTFGNLPFTVKSQSNGDAVGSLRLSVLTWPASTTCLNFRALNNTTTGVAVATGSAVASPSNVQMANTAFSAIYTIAYEV